MWSVGSGRLTVDWNECTGETGRIEAGGSVSDGFTKDFSPGFIEKMGSLISKNHHLADGLFTYSKEVSP